VGDVASVIGDIEIGGNSNVWPAKVMRDNSCRIIGATNTNLEDICAVHGLTKVVM
jgi:carbonic anhydrase/acetyltransferase-like protein (isoleucine patch superfamily)